MTTPLFSQLSDPTQPGPGFSAETYAQRLLTILSMIASGQNPDGTQGVTGIGLTHTPTAGLTADLSIRGALVTVRDEKLNAVEAGYLVQNSVSDQHTGLQNFLTAIGGAVGGRGGSGYIPSGIYHMGNGTVTYPSGVTCGVEGEMPPASYGTGTAGIGGTVLVWDSDVGGLADTTWGITLGGSSGFQQSLRQMTLEGPGTFFVSHPGIRPATLGGINAFENNVLEDLNIENFSSGIGWGGPSQSYDHSNPRNLRIATCGYGWNFLAGNAGGGDFNAHGCNLNGSLAGIGVAQGCSTGLNGMSLIGCGLYGPIGIHRYGDTSGLQGNLVDATQFIDTSFENNGVAAIYDEQWQSGVLGSFIQFSTFSNGFGWRAPNAAFAQWSATFSVSTSSGTSLTLTDGTGFVFRPGMTVVGTGVPANTVINSVAGNWPWSTVVLTLNNSVTSPTSVVVGQPLLATWVAYHITDNDISGPALGESVPGFPLVACSFFGRNRVKDGTGMLSRAQNGPLIIGSPALASTFAWGNSIGDTGDNGCLVLGSGIPSTGALAAGDVLMTRSNANGQLTKCDATRRPIGVAIRANNASNNGNVDYLVRASFDNAGTTIPIINKGASNIAAGALVKVDAANPGGVTTASSPNDGWVIGVNGASIINAGTSGNLGELWL